MAPEPETRLDVLAERYQIFDEKNAGHFTEAYIAGLENAVMRLEDQLEKCQSDLEESRRGAGDLLTLHLQAQEMLRESRKKLSQTAEIAEKDARAADHFARILRMYRQGTY